jgi:hypothetical protein
MCICIYTYAYIYIYIYIYIHIYIYRAHQLFLKNTTIQACRKLFFENRISEDEYEKLIRTEIVFLEEKERNEAVAATLRYFIYTHMYSCIYTRKCTFIHTNI